MKVKENAVVCLFLFALLPLTATAQTFEDKFTRSLSDVMADVQSRFGIRLKYDMDTTGLKIAYADFRIRPYSVEETLTNLLSPFDFKPVYQQGNLWKVKRYEYPRRQPADGKKLIAWLGSLYNNKVEWESRRDTLRAEVRQRLGIDPLLRLCLSQKNEFGPVRKHDGYTVQNFRLTTVNGHTVCGSIYSPVALSWKKGKFDTDGKRKTGKYPLIVCPNGHFNGGRYNADLQRRYATLARMGAVCVSYDLWGWGESEDEVGTAAHHTSEAHVMQVLNGLRILDLLYAHKDTDRAALRARPAVHGRLSRGQYVIVVRRRLSLRERHAHPAQRRRHLQCRTGSTVCSEAYDGGERRRRLDQHDARTGVPLSAAHLRFLRPSGPGQERSPARRAS